MSEKAGDITVEALLSEQEWLRALARRLVTDEARADDLLQDVWVRVLQGPPRTVRSVRAWLTRVLVNRSRDVRRSEAAREGREGSAPRPPDAPSAGDMVARVDAQQRVAAAVLELEEPLRETVLLRFFEDLPVRGIARRMGVPYETARARLTKGLDRLRACLAPRDGRSERTWSAGFLLLAGLDRTRDVSATAALTGVVIAMKTKIAVTGAVLVLLAAAIGGIGLIASDPDDPDLPAPPEDVALVDEPAPEENGPADQEPPAAPASVEPDEETAAEKQDPNRGTCHGRISHADGRPAAGVQVRLSGSPAKVVRTDADGRFRLVNEWVDALGRNLLVGPETGQLALGNVSLRAGEDVKFDAVIPAGPPLAIEVVSAEDGRPLSGVWVNFRSLTEPVFPSPHCVTGEDGKGGFEQAPPRVYRISIGSEGFQPFAARLDLTGRAPQEVLRIALKDPEEFRLRVVPPPTGKNRTVSVAFFPVPDDPVKGQHSVHLTLADDGTAVGIAPAPGRYRAHVDVYGVTRRMFEGIEVREREPLEITLERPTGVEVRGVVLLPDDRPVRARVTLHPKVMWPADGTARQASANEKGEFRIAEVPVGRCWVDVQIGRQTLYQVMDDVEVAEGGLPDLRVRLAAGGGLTGGIVGSDRPNAHFVWFLRKSGDQWVNVASAVLDLHGKFDVRHLPAGNYFVRMNPYHGSHGYARPIRVEVREGETAGPLDFNWKPCPPLSLTVASVADGSPVTGTVEITGVPTGGGGDTPPGGLLRRHRATLDENGRTVLRTLSPGRFRIQVEIRGAPERTVTVEVEVKEEGNEPIRVFLPD